MLKRGKQSIMVKQWAVYKLLSSLPYLCLTSVIPDEEQFSSKEIVLGSK